MAENVTELLPLKEDCQMSMDFNPRDIDSFPKSAIPTWTAVSIISGITSIPTLYINLLVIWTILESERLRSAHYNLVLAVLSVTDFLVGLIVLPLFSSLNACFILQCPSTCNIGITYAVSALLCIGCSLCTLVIVSLERYFCVEYPLYYTDKITTKKIMTSLAVSMVLTAMILLPSRWNPDYSYKVRKISVTVLSSLSIIIIGYCLTKVSLTAHRQMRAINIQQAAVQQTTQNKIRDYKRTFALGIVVIISILSYSPLLIANVIVLTKGIEWNADFQYISQCISLSFVHFHSLINPLILSLRLSHIRAGVTKKLKAHLTWLCR